MGIVIPSRRRRGGLASCSGLWAAAAVLLCLLLCCLVPTVDAQVRCVLLVVYGYWDGGFGGWMRILR